MAAFRRLLVGLLAGLGIAAFLRSRRQKPAPVAYESSLADELREKLAASRRAEEEVEAATGEPPAVETDLKARRREVHDRARGSIDELGAAGEPSDT
jgi:hypothetical protein